MTKWDILQIVGKSLALGVRVVAIVPAAWYHKRQALAAFNRELRRSQIPDPVRRGLGERYRAMLPLNPLQYRRSRHSLTFHERTLPNRDPNPNRSPQLSELGVIQKESQRFIKDSHLGSQ